MTSSEIEKLLDVMTQRDRDKTLVEISLTLGSLDNRVKNVEESLSKAPTRCTELRGRCVTEVNARIAGAVEKADMAIAKADEVTRAATENTSWRKDVVKSFAGAALALTFAVAVLGFLGFEVMHTRVVPQASAASPTTMNGR